MAVPEAEYCPRIGSELLAPFTNEEAQEAIRVLVPTGWRSNRSRCSGRRAGSRSRTGTRSGLRCRRTRRCRRRHEPREPSSTPPVVSRPWRRSPPRLARRRRRRRRWRHRWRRRWRHRLRHRPTMAHRLPRRLFLLLHHLLLLVRSRARMRPLRRQPSRRGIRGSSPCEAAAAPVTFRGNSAPARWSSCSRCR